MNVLKIGRDHLRIQKHFFSNLCDSVDLFHNYMEKAQHYCAHHIGAANQLQTAFDDNWIALKKNRDDIREMIHESLTIIECYFDRINAQTDESGLMHFFKLENSNPSTRK